MIWIIREGKKKKKKEADITISQGREALVGSLFLCESVLQATKPPKPSNSKIK